MEGHGVCFFQVCYKVDLLVTDSPLANSIYLSNPPCCRLTTLHHCMEETYPYTDALKSKEDII